MRSGGAEIVPAMHKRYVANMVNMFADSRCTA
jgi:hypothetical protein